MKDKSRKTAILNTAASSKMEGLPLSKKDIKIINDLLDHKTSLSQQLHILTQKGTN